MDAQKLQAGAMRAGVKRGKEEPGTGIALALVATAQI